MNTPMKKMKLAGLTLIGAALATILLVSLTAATASPAAPTVFGATISGTVSKPADPGSLELPVPVGTWVWLLDPTSPCVLDPFCTWDDATVHGKAIVDPVSGAFDFPPVAPGTYLIRAVAPFFSAYTPSLIQPVAVLNTPVNVGTLYLTNPTITGTVYLPDGVTDAGLDNNVHVFAGPIEVEVRRTQADGTFRIGGLWPGDYTLVAEPRPDEWLWWSQKIHDTLVPSETHYVTLTLRAPQVYGYVEDEDGQRISEATVGVYVSNSQGHKDVTGPLGKFAIDDLPNGPALLHADPPPDRGGLLPITRTVMLTEVDPITLTLISSPKVVTGFVTTNVMTPVYNAQIVANRVGAFGKDSTLSDVNGSYRLNLSPGLWALTVRPISTTDPGRWVYPLPPQLIHFDDDLKPESKQLDFKVLTADATVIGLVEKPDHSPPEFPVFVGLHTDEGIGVEQRIEPNGQFTFTVPHGGYKVTVRVVNPMTGTLYAAPPVDPVFAEPLVTTMIPTITLVTRDAVITGMLTVSGTNAPAGGVPVIAWNPTANAAFQTRAASDGNYVMAVYSGTWQVRPAPLPDQPYLYTGAAEQVQVTTGQTSPNHNFSLLYADSVIHGVLTDPDGVLATDAQGWGKAVQTTDETIRNGAPVKDGFFDILVPGNATYSVSLRLADGSKYLYTGAVQPASVGISETKTLTFSLTMKNAKFVGYLRDVRADMGVRGVPAKVWAWNDDISLSTGVNTGNGMYTLTVPAGVWGLNYDVPEDSEYVKLAGPRYYAVPDAPPVVANLPVMYKDSWLTGTVLLPDGNPAVGATAIADGFSPGLQNLRLRAEVGANGTFAMNLPSGRYVVRAVGESQPGLINPVEKYVNVPPNGTANVTLQYRRPDVTITGQVMLSGTETYTGPVSLWTWSNAGGYNTTKTQVGGAYTMPVISNTLWHLVAVYETSDQYWKANVRVPVTTTSVVRNLVLDGPFPKPGPVSVLFDSTMDQDIELSDGTRIHIPAGAMPVSSGNVLLNITPLAGAPHHRDGEVLGLTYAFEAFTEDGQPITDHFNQDVVITLKYSEAALLMMGLDEDHLKPAYFSTTTNSWTFPESFVVDEVHNEITMQIDHFTRFGALSTQGANFVFLPTVLR
jgi:hypothetical protein